MGNCLITKLKGVVTNDELLKLDEIKVRFGSNQGKPFRTKFEGDITIKALTGSLTDSTGMTSLSEAKGSTSEIYVKENTIVSISSKYNLVSFCIYNNRSDGKENDVTFDFDLLKYTALGSVEISGGEKVTGDVSIMNDKNSGYVVLSNMKNVYGTINYDGKSTNLSTLRVSKVPNVCVDIDGLSGASGLLSISVEANSKGSINSLPASITQISLYGAEKITGDLSLMNNKLHSVYAGTLTWKNERDNTYPIISLQYVNLGEDCDRMLINQAKCPASTVAPAKNIVVFGTRTSASDNAISTLQEKGYTVSVGSAL